MLDLVKTIRERYFPTRPNSAAIAAERLKIILAHERRGVNAPLMEQMKEDIIRVVSRFVEVDSQNIEVRLIDDADADIEMLEVTVPFNR